MNARFLTFFVFLPIMTKLINVVADEQPRINDRTAYVVRATATLTNGFRLSLLH